MAPVMSFTAAEAWEHLPHAVAGKRRKSHDIFLQEFPGQDENVIDLELDKKWKRLLEVRSEITRALEGARRDKVIGHPLEAKVLVKVTGSLEEFERCWLRSETVGDDKNHPELCSRCTSVVAHIE